MKVSILIIGFVTVLVSLLILVLVIFFFRSTSSSDQTDDENRNQVERASIHYSAPSSDDSSKIIDATLETFGKVDPNSKLSDQKEQQFTEILNSMAESLPREKDVVFKKIQITLKTDPSTPIPYPYILELTFDLEDEAKEIILEKVCQLLEAQIQDLQPESLTALSAQALVLMPLRIEHNNLILETGKIQYPRTINFSEYDFRNFKSLDDDAEKLHRIRRFIVHIMHCRELDAACEKAKYKLQYDMGPIIRDVLVKDPIKKNKEELAAIDLVLLKDTFKEDPLYTQLYNSAFHFDKTILLQLFAEKEKYGDILALLPDFYGDRAAIFLEKYYSFEAQSFLHHDPDFKSALELPVKLENVISIFILLRNVIKRDANNIRHVQAFVKGHLHLDGYNMDIVHRHLHLLGYFDKSILVKLIEDIEDICGRKLEITDLPKQEIEKLLGLINVAYNEVPNCLIREIPIICALISPKIVMQYAYISLQLSHSISTSIVSILSERYPTEFQAFKQDVDRTLYYYFLRYFDYLDAKAAIEAGELSIRAIDKMTFERSFLRKMRYHKDATKPHSLHKRFLDLAEKYSLTHSFDFSGKKEPVPGEDDQNAEEYIVNHVHNEDRPLMLNIWAILSVLSDFYHHRSPHPIKTFKITLEMVKRDYLEGWTYGNAIHVFVEIIERAVKEAEGKDPSEWMISEPLSLNPAIFPPIPPLYQGLWTRFIFPELNQSFAQLVIQFGMDHSEALKRLCTSYCYDREVSNEAALRNYQRCINKMFPLCAGFEEPLELDEYQLYVDSLHLPICLASLFI